MNQVIPDLRIVKNILTSQNVIINVISLHSYRLPHSKLVEECYNRIYPS